MVCSRSAFRCWSRRAHIFSTSIWRRLASMRATRISASASWSSTRSRPFRWRRSMKMTRCARWCGFASPNRMRQSTRRWSGCRACCGVKRTAVKIAKAFVVLAAAMGLSSAQAAERVVNFYNWSSYMAPGVLEDFTKETGIKVVYDTFDANETLETRLLAGKSGYDVVVPTAYFLQRQIKANIFQKLDTSKLPNLANAWPVVTERLGIYDPGNVYAANYMWGTTGIGYNVAKVKQILGADAKIDSWDIVFKPENLAKFKDCGVHMLDSADDIFPAALSYLGLDPNSTKQPDLEKA